MKRIVYLTLLFLWVTQAANAQITIKGKVVEKNNENRSIANATLTITNSKLIYSTSKLGDFEIKIPAALEDQALVVSALGYNSSTIAIKSLSREVNIIGIAPAIYELKDVVVTAAKAKKVYLGTLKNSSYGKFCPYPELDHALYFPNDNNMTGTIKAVKFYIKQCENGVIDAPFRVKLLHKDDSHDYPGKELLKDAIIGHAVKNGAWVTVDVSQYNLDVPWNGFFVVLEILPTQYYAGEVTTSATTDDDKKIILKHYPAPAIGYEKREEIAPIYSWYKYSGDIWKRQEKYSYMIGVEIIADK
ncbi:carboxypeptidase-like regulatory domain-containing protein [Solitalea koreensis]|uniref:CarboxypepD_reg-like domain-containing protein n=1 Tax=Solitalea koreensis TaxID=543615 RepID=A0A521CLS5_9SPHI|nr:carboxypeptidase-like regulatory domain-containing protein [Solitalea koreensis]SMO60315.1 CarboxypepD_reg-like domain-containing protein [Solitalea koreensis]